MVFAAFIGSALMFGGAMFLGHKYCPMMKANCCNKCACENCKCVDCKCNGGKCDCKNCK